MKQELSTLEQEIVVQAERVIVKVPASSANLGPGFDSLGIALNLYGWVSLAASDSTNIQLLGNNLNGIPTDKSNLVYEVAQAVFQRVGIHLPELDITIRSDIPLTRGLGSSAAAIVGALVAANTLTGSQLSEDELFQMATSLEKHPDNVGASLFGGLVIAAWDGKRAEYVRIEPPKGVDYLVAIPEFELSTKKARNVLPEQISLSDAAFNVSHSSLLTAALTTGRLDLLKSAMRDKLHQPYRAALIPGMNNILQEAAMHGALGAVLSGAGPTILLLAESAGSSKEQLVTFVEGVMAKEGISVTTQWLDSCLHGPQIRCLKQGHPDYNEDPKFILPASEMRNIE